MIEGRNLKDEGRRLLVIAHIGFILTGVVATLLGSLLPVLAAKWNLDDAAAGRLFIAQFAGSLTGLWLSGSLVARFGVTRSLAIGFALIMIGVAVVGTGSPVVGWSAILIYGTGLGLTLPAINLLVAKSNPQRRAAALNILNFLWGIGAMCSAPFVVLFVARVDNSGNNGMTTQGLFVLASSLGVVALCLASLRGNDSTRISSERVDVENVTPNVNARLEALRRRRLLMLFGAMMFLNVGAESAVGGWVALHASRVPVQGAAHGVAWSGYAPMMFWASLLAGRCLAPVVLRFMSDEKLILVSLSVAASGIAGLCLEASQGRLVTGIVCAGLGFAPVFPNTVAALTHSFGATTTGVTRIAFTMGTLGGVVMPWMVGIVSDRAGDLRFGLGVTLCACVLMMFLQLALMRDRRGFSLDQDAQITPTAGE